MKQVFTNDMVAHVWAQQSQQSGRSSNGQFYFEGDTIFSYGRHFPIARITQTLQGDRVALFTDRGYSVTTSNHINMAKRAVHHMPIIYCHAPLDLPENNLHVYKKQIEAALGNLAKARMKKSKVKHFEAANAILAQMNVYGHAFKPDYVAETLPAELEAIEELANELAEKEAAAKAERERLREAEFLGNFIIAYNCGPEDYLRKWQRGLVNTVPTCLNRLLGLNPGTYLLRLKGDAIETTGGASFPVEHGKRAWPVVLRIKQQSSKISFTDRLSPDKPRLGSFSIDEITPDGVKAGCHFVPFGEVERIAKELGIAA